MTKYELKEILNKHQLWIKSNRELGERANLRDADLRWSNLRDADLRWSNLRGADLRDADLRDADLRWSDLRWSNLRGADLRYADLRDADLRGANLRYADLRWSDLRYADLRDADLAGVEVNSDTLGYHLSCPEEGSFIAFKKCKNDTILKLLIPEDAKRSSATTKKCRASKAIVLDITDKNGKQIEAVGSMYNSDFIYEVGEVVEVEDFDEDRWNECSTGIHFFLTRGEAEVY